MVDESFLTAQEAADELGVKIGTIYAYVSRGFDSVAGFARGPAASALFAG